MGVYLKDPDAAIDYTVDWAVGYLLGREISESSWSVLPEEAGGVVVEASVREATRTAATISGGIPGHVYSVTNRIQISDGRTDERSLMLRVEHR